MAAAIEGKELRKSFGTLDAIKSKTLALVGLGEVDNGPVSKFSFLGGSIATSIVLAQLMNAPSFILAILSIGFISLGIGFIHKSVSATIVTAILLAAILGNALMGLGASTYAFVDIMALFVIGLGFAKSTNHQINNMEV